MTTATETENIGTATYTNKAAGGSYRLGFTYSDNETALSRAWDLVSVAANANGWNRFDIFVSNAS